MPRSSTFTVAFRSTTSETAQVSRFFQTLSAARRWAAHLASKSYVAEVSLYRGPAGGELIERLGA